MGEISFVSFLEEGHEVLESQELHKHVPGLLGVFILSIIPIRILVLLLVASLFHSLIHFFTHALHYSLFTPFMEISLHYFLSPTHLSSFSCLVLGKEDELLKSIHGIVGSRYCWCNPTMI
jgi:hypothetical protein